MKPVIIAFLLMMRDFHGTIAVNVCRMFIGIVLQRDGFGRSLSQSHDWIFHRASGSGIARKIVQLLCLYFAQNPSQIAEYIHCRSGANHGGRKKNGVENIEK